MPNKLGSRSSFPSRKSSGPATQTVLGTTISGAKAHELVSRGYKVESVWQPFPAQVRALHRLEREIFYAGSRWGGKTSLGTIWMIIGNLDKPETNPDGSPNLTNISYVHHPQYIGYVIRANEKDLADWIQKARPYYCDILGGTFTQNPAVFSWPGGGHIYLGHAKDADAWTKYQGQNIVRFLIDEAGQIPNPETLDLLLASCRSVYPEMRAQMLLTANPGGRGQAMLFDRYIEPKDRDGRPIKHPHFDRPISMEDQGMITIEETVPHPFKPGETLTSTRVWVPSFMTDNPHAVNDPGYIASIATMRDEKTRKAFLYGDWRALSGTYFDIFNRETHTYDPKLRPLASWWRTSASLDWGFKHKSAAYWHKRDPETKQHLVFREFTTTRTDPVELGSELARQSSDILRVQGALTFWVSHDLFHERIGEFTWADLLAKGVNRVLGKNQCYLPDQVVKQLKEKYALEGRTWTDEMEDRIVTKEVKGIVFRRAPAARAVGFMHMRSLMRVEPMVRPASTTPIKIPDLALAREILEVGSQSNFADYLKSFEAAPPEILPELLISTDCKELISAIPKAIHSEDDPNDIDDTHFDGMDSLDSLRYLLTGIRDERPTPLPVELEKERRMAEAKRLSPSLSYDSQVWIARQIEDELAEAERSGDGFTLGRNARWLRRQHPPELLQ